MQHKLPRYIPAIFTPEDANALSLVTPAVAQSLALNNDEAFYSRSDIDFKTRHRQQWSAARQFEAQTLSEIEGDTTPAWQGAVMRLAISATSPASGSGIAGSIGNFAVARSVALNVENLRSQGRDDLQTLNQLFPERMLGIGGSLAVQLQLANEGAFNGVVIGNNQGLNSTNLINAMGKRIRDNAEYLREFGRNNKPDAGFRSLDGALTGLYEGWTYGSRYGGYVAGIYGALGGMVGGAVEGAVDGWSWRVHEQAGEDVLGNVYGWNDPNNPYLQNRDFGTGFDTQYLKLEINAGKLAANTGAVFAS